MTVCIAHQHIVYLCGKYVKDMRAGMHPDVPTYLDIHMGAHTITGQFEDGHIWIAPVYVSACEVRVPTCAVWTVGE